MKNGFKDYRRILIYTILGAGIGIIVGALDTLFGRGLMAITAFREQHVTMLVPFLAAAGVFTLWMFQKISPKSQKGMTLIFETGVEENEEIPKALIPLIVVSTWITHLFGGSAGRVGVTMQVGGTVSHTIGKMLKRKEDEKIFLIIGIAAGFAGLFQTPLAATFFAMEVLVVGAMFYEALFPALTAAYAASCTSHMLGFQKFSISFSNTLSYDGKTVAELVVIAILFGMAGGLFSHFLATAKEKAAELIENPYIRIAAGGVLLSVLFLVLFKGRYCGLGTHLTLGCFQGEKIYGFDFILKAALTILTIAAGFQGGEIAPLFSIGATFGVFLASVLGLPQMLIAALGLIAVFGSATNTLMAPIFFGIEVFGAEHAVLFAVVCIIAFEFNGNKTIYGKQRISRMLDYK